LLYLYLNSPEGRLGQEEEEDSRSVWAGLPMQRRMAGKRRKLGKMRQTV